MTPREPNFAQDANVIISVKTSDPSIWLHRQRKAGWLKKTAATPKGVAAVFNPEPIRLKADR
jgi:hypothetical protein